MYKKGHGHMLKCMNVFMYIDVAHDVYMYVRVCV